MKQRQGMSRNEFRLTSPDRWSKRLRRKRAPNRNKRIKASRRWKRERAKVSQLQRKVTRQREDWLHQMTSSIVSANSLVAGEQLDVKGMTRKGKRKCKRGLNRSILEVGFGTIGRLLDYKLKEANGIYIESPTRTLKPTQRCAQCWQLSPKTLSGGRCFPPVPEGNSDRLKEFTSVNIASIPKTAMLMLLKSIWLGLGGRNCPLYTWSRLALLTAASKDTAVARRYARLAEA